jgi:hypothetical protein
VREAIKTAISLRFAGHRLEAQDSLAKTSTNSALEVVPGQTLKVLNEPLGE